MIAALLANGGEAAFFEVVRLLQASSRRDGAVGVGHQGPPSREPLRFRPALDLSFGVNEVDGCSRGEEGAPFEVACRFFGIYGTVSPLPACYTEQLLYDDPDGRLRAFLDVFNHRLLSFVFRAWEKYRHAVQYDGRGDDATTRRLRLLCHVERDGEPLPLLGWAGLLHQQPLSEASLEQILTASLRVPIAVHSCHVRWVVIPPHQRSSLGRSNCTLGGLAPIGRELRAANTAFRVHVGPLPQGTYLDFLPGGPRRAALCALLDRLNQDELDCVIAIEIVARHAHGCTLGGGAGGLGWTTWLGQQSPQLAHARGDTVSHTLHRGNTEGPEEQGMVA